MTAIPSLASPLPVRTLISTMRIREPGYSIIFHHYGHNLPHTLQAWFCSRKIPGQFPTPTRLYILILTRTLQEVASWLVKSYFLGGEKLLLGLRKVASCRGYHKELFFNRLYHSETWAANGSGKVCEVTSRHVGKLIDNLYHFASPILLPLGKDWVKPISALAYSQNSPFILSP